MPGQNAGNIATFGIKMNGTDMQGQHAGEILPVNLYPTVNLKFGENLIEKNSWGILQGKSPLSGVKSNGKDMQGQHAGEILPVNLYPTVNLMLQAS
jgi:hypothetical protein